MQLKNTPVFEHLLASLKGKIILTFIVSGLAVLIAWILTGTLFNETRKTVKNLSIPNERLVVIDSLYYAVNELNRLQYIGNTLSNTAANKRMATIVKKTNHRLQELREMEQTNSLQLQRIDTLTQLIAQYKTLYTNYTKLKSEILRNSALGKNIKELEGLLSLSKVMIDSNVKTTKKKTTTISEPVDETSEKTQLGQIIEKIFGKRKEKPQLKKTVIEEEKIRIDTLTVGQKDSMQRAILSHIDNMTLSQHRKTSRFIEKEKELIFLSNQLIRQMYNMVASIKHEEAVTTGIETQAAARILKQGLFNINALLVLFLVAIGLLLLLILFDLSKSNQYRIALQKAKQDAEEAAIAKQNFLANMSHEIRTPLQSIMGFAEQAKNAEVADKETIRTIFNASTHLLQVVNEVLDYSKITSGKISLNITPFKLNTLVDEVADVFEKSAKEKGLLFTIQNNNKGFATLKGDVFRIKQILFNLLGNALKFTKEGEIKLRVFTEKQFTVFEVTDTGVGITENQLKGIFNEFEQAHEKIASTYGGSGLGLTIVQQLVQQMQGEIKVTSTPEKGSTFTITIPLPVEETHLPVAITSPTSNPIKINKYKPIWLVDDDSFIRQLCETIFKKHQLNYTIFNSAHELLHATQPETKPLVFADIRMPEMDGVTLCKTLKNKWPKLNIVAVTAQAMAYEKEHILKQGFDAILTKPFLEEDLLSVIAQIQDKNVAVEFDLKNIKTMSGDDDTFKHQITNIILETNVDVEQLQQNIANNDVKNTYEILHKLAGRIGMIGAKSLHQNMRLYEQKLVQVNSLEEYKNDFEEIISAIHELIEALKKEV